MQLFNSTCSLAGVQILQSVPLSQSIAECCDRGKPIVLSASNSVQADTYKDLAEHVTLFLAKQPQNKD